MPPRWTQKGRPLSRLRRERYARAAWVRLRSRRREINLPGLSRAAMMVNHPRTMQLNAVSTCNLLFSSQIPLSCHRFRSNTLPAATVFSMPAGRMDLASPYLSLMRIRPHYTPERSHRSARCPALIMALKHVRLGERLRFVIALNTYDKRVQLMWQSRRRVSCRAGAMESMPLWGTTLE